MANQLAMDKALAIQGLAATGMSERRIAAALSISRKAVVSEADWHDPELNPKIVEFCRHYGCALLPTRPRTPQHKGKIERGEGSVKCGSDERSHLSASR